jgi:ATP-dependent protease ClpP protease subunit
MSNNTKEDWEPHINVIANDIWYTGNITLIGVVDLIKELEQAINNKHVNHKINLFIGSDGGSVTSALMLYNYLNLNDKHINIVGTNGLSSSATYFLFTRCDTFVYPNMYALFHPMNFEFNDNQQAVSKRNGFYKRLIRMVNDIYKSKNFRCSWNTTDTYLYANDLIKKGIIEGIWRTI